MIKQTLILLFAVLLFTTADLYAGDPIPGIDITLTNVDTKEIHKTKTDAKGEYSFTNLEPGQYTLTVSSGNSSYTFGKKPKESIVVGKSSDGARDKSVRKRPGRTVRKRPGRVKYGDIPLPRKLAKELLSSSSSTNKQKSDYNSSRSNKTYSADYVDDDDDGDGIPTAKANHNTTRSNQASGKNNDETTSKGKTKRIDKATPLLSVQVTDTKVHGSLKASHDAAMNSIRNMK